MKSLLNFKRFKFYAWVGFAFLAMSLLMDVHEHRSDFTARMFDNLWMAMYVTIINYTLFEYSSQRLKWRKFFTSLFIIIIYIFLYSQGSFLWRLLGINIGLY